MGVTTVAAQMLLDAAKRGVSFERMLTIGRQTLYVPKRQLFKLARTHRIRSSARLRSDGFGSPADPFFHTYLGAQKICSIDASTYDGATIKWDLNLPVPSKWHGQYDVVLDGGSLEHIFNFPVALASCMAMVRPGGRLFIFTVANNHCGHGFYQFSPEVFYRALSADNGYRIIAMVLAEHSYPGIELGGIRRAVEVVDPAIAGHRINVITSRPLALCLEAERTSTKPIVSPHPFQSDYVNEWRRKGTDRSPGFLSLAWRSWSRLLPFSVRNRIIGHLQLWNARLSNRRHFKPVRK